jgi:hypothetical protein
MCSAPLNSYAKDSDLKNVKFYKHGCDLVKIHQNKYLANILVNSSCEISADENLETELIFSNYKIIATLKFNQLNEIFFESTNLKGVLLAKSGDFLKYELLNAWHGRDGAGLVELNSRLYLLGGWLYGPASSEVWATSDLKNWEFLGSAPWPPRHLSGWVVFNGRIYVVGGDFKRDVWSSVDGVHWVEEAREAEFEGRYSPNVVVHDGAMYYLNGMKWEPEIWCHTRVDCEASGFGSIYKSTDGKRWIKEPNEVPFEPRGLIVGGIEYNDKIYVIGGGLVQSKPHERHIETIKEYTDVWSFSKNKWQKETGDWGIEGRTLFSVISTLNGCYLSDGSVGAQRNLSSDLFYSPNCVNFFKLKTPNWWARRHASSLVFYNGSIVILGGPPYGNAGSDIYQYFP